MLSQRDDLLNVFCCLLLVHAVIRSCCWVFSILLQLYLTCTDWICYFSCQKKSFCNVLLLWIFTPGFGINHGHSKAGGSIDTELWRYSSAISHIQQFCRNINPELSEKTNCALNCIKCLGTQGFILNSTFSTPQTVPPPLALLLSQLVWPNFFASACLKSFLHLWASSQPIDVTEMIVLRLWLYFGRVIVSWLSLDCNNAVLWSVNVHGVCSWCRETLLSNYLVSYVVLWHDLR